MYHRCGWLRVQIVGSQEIKCSLSAVKVWQINPVICFKLKEMFKAVVLKLFHLRKSYFLLVVFYFLLLVLPLHIMLHFSQFYHSSWKLYFLGERDGLFFFSILELPGDISSSSETLLSSVLQATNEPHQWQCFSFLAFLLYSQNFHLSTNITHLVLHNSLMVVPLPGTSHLSPAAFNFVFLTFDFDSLIIM